MSQFRILFIFIFVIQFLLRPKPNRIVNVHCITRGTIVYGMICRLSESTTNIKCYRALFLTNPFRRLVFFVFCVQFSPVKCDNKRVFTMYFEYIRSKEGETTFLGFANIQSAT